MRYSVVIPARNSARTLGTTLDAIVGGTRQPDEILVVDGCSDDGTHDLARARGVLVVTNEKRHVAAARQLGVTTATGDVVAFTDSDCVPAADWLQRVAAHFDEHRDLDGVGGPVFLSTPRNDIQRYSAQVFESIMHFPETARFVTRKGMEGSFAGANCVYRRPTVLAAGGFRDEFTNHAEEIDLFWRLIDRGAKLLFDPLLRVEHLDYADTLSRLIRTNFNYGFASTKLAKYHIGTQFDFILYRIWMKSFASTLNPLRRDRWAPLRCLQIGSFIAGKICSSVLLGTVNL
jgi:glycosyltransferase involved in cell wall biosynthesis